jgi:hypothetical protein
MRTLNIDELNDIQGGRLVKQWAQKLGELIAETYKSIQAAKETETETDTSNYGPVDASGYNPMGDFSDTASAA